MSLSTCLFLQFQTNEHMVLVVWYALAKELAVIQTFWRLHTDTFISERTQ